MTESIVDAVAPSVAAIGAASPRKVFWATWFGWMLDGFDSSMYGYILVSALSELLPASGIEPSKANIGIYGGLLFSIFMLGWACSMVWGWAADRYGRVRIMCWTVLVYSLFTALCGLATGIVMFALFRFVAGFGIGGEWAAGTPLLQESVPENTRVRLAGWLHTATPTGLFLAAAVTLVIGSTLGWRGMFLLGILPALLIAYLRKLNLTLAASFLLYLAARHFGWNLPAYPGGSWYFNPFCWQFLFVFGGWFALGGASESITFIRSRAFLWLGGAYLLFALVMTLAGRFPELGQAMPPWLYDAFNPNDKTNLAPYRVLHFVVLAFFVTRFLPREWAGYEWPVFQPIIKCGQQSLEVFCSGVFLAVVAHVVLVEVSGSLWMQIVVSVIGIVLMTVLAYYRSWSKKVDKAPKPPVAAQAPAAPKPAA